MYTSTCIFSLAELHVRYMYAHISSSDAQVVSAHVFANKGQFKVHVHLYCLRSAVLKTINTMTTAKWNNFKAMKQNLCMSVRDKTYTNLLYNAHLHNTRTSCNDISQPLYAPQTTRALFQKGIGGGSPVGWSTDSSSNTRGSPSTTYTVAVLPEWAMTLMVDMDALPGRTWSSMSWETAGNDWPILCLTLLLQCTNNTIRHMYTVL